MEVPSTAACFALLIEHDESKSRSKTLMLEKQCILGLADEVKELRTKVANIEKSNAFAKITSTKRQNKNCLTVAEKLVVALEAKLKEAQDSQNRGIGVARKFRETRH